jgi:hypothetical protein
MANLEQLAQRLQSESEPERLAAVTELATQADQRNVDDAVHIPMMRQEGLMAAVVKISKVDGEDAQAQAFMAVTRIARAVANARPLLAFPGLVDSAISTTKTSTGLARQWACTALSNISFADGIEREMYQYECLVVTRGVAGSMTMAQYRSPPPAPPPFPAPCAALPHLPPPLPSLARSVGAG